MNTAENFLRVIARSPLQIAVSERPAAAAETSQWVGLSKELLANAKGLDISPEAEAILTSISGIIEHLSSQGDFAPQTHPEWVAALYPERMNCIAVAREHVGEMDPIEKTIRQIANTRMFEEMSEDQRAGGDFSKSYNIAKLGTFAGAAELLLEMPREFSMAPEFEEILKEAVSQNAKMLTSKSCEIEGIAEDATRDLIRCARDVTGIGIEIEHDPSMDIL